MEGTRGTVLVPVRLTALTLIHTLTRTLSRTCVALKNVSIYY